MTLPRTPRLSLVCLLAVSLLLAGCAGFNERQRLPQAAAMHMTFEAESPVAVGPGHLAMLLAAPDGRPIEGAGVEFEATMGHAGMHPLRAKAREAADGRYEAPFKWTMSGDWVLTVTASLADGQATTQQFTVTVEDKLAHGHDHGNAHGQPERLPSEGAAIRIVSPEDGTVFEAGEEVWVEIEYNHFNLVEAGNHWHIYVDGQTKQMVMGDMTEAVLRNLEPGQHQISVYLSVGGHAELEPGASITISVMAPQAAEAQQVGKQDKDGHE